MSEEASKKRPSGLGRGLSALLGEIHSEAVSTMPASSAAALPEGVRMVDIGALSPLPDQPRKNFDDGPLDELAESIKLHGVLQPILVRAVDDRWQIVAGERRWRAAQRAQLHQVPVIVRDFDDRTALEIALVENVQREQLNAWEEGETYRRLVEDFGHSHEALGKAVGKSRSHVSNLIRIREHLPIRVHNWLSGGELTMGHARALLLCEDPEGLAKQVIDRRLSVRETEALAKKFKPGAPKKQRATAERDADLASLEQHLGNLLGVKVRVAHGGRGGSLTLNYSTLDQLDMICQRLSGDKI